MAGFLDCKSTSQTQAPSEVQSRKQIQVFLSWEVPEGSNTVLREGAGVLVCPELVRKAKRPKKQALRRSRPEAGGSVLHPLLPGPAGQLHPRWKQRNLKPLKHILRGNQFYN